MAERHGQACTVCGATGRLDSHAPGLERFFSQVRAPVCPRCHRALTSRQYEVGILREPSGPPLWVLVQGCLDLVASQADSLALRYEDARLHGVADAARRLGLGVGHLWWLTDAEAGQSPAPFGPEPAKNARWRRRASNRRPRVRSGAPFSSAAQLAPVFADLPDPHVALRTLGGAVFPEALRFLFAHRLTIARGLAVLCRADRLSNVVDAFLPAIDWMNEAADAMLGASRVDQAFVALTTLRERSDALFMGGLLLLGELAAGEDPLAAADRFLERASENV